MIEAREYVDSRGKVPYRDWLVSLDVVTRVRVITAVLRLEQGNTSNAKAVGAGLSELRLHFGPGYRVYFGWDGDELVMLLGGGTKQRQHLDVVRANALWIEYKRRKLEV